MCFAVFLISSFCFLFLYFIQRLATGFRLGEALVSSEAWLSGVVMVLVAIGEAILTERQFMRGQPCRCFLYFARPSFQVKWYILLRKQATGVVSVALLAPSLRYVSRDGGRTDSERWPCVEQCLVLCGQWMTGDKRRRGFWRPEEQGEFRRQKKKGLVAHSKNSHEGLYAFFMSHC